MKKPIENSKKMAKNKTFALLAFLFLALNSIIQAQTVTPWVTTNDKSKLIEEQAVVDFSPSSTGSSIITVNQDVSYQSIDGFGFCLTQGSAQVISGLETAQQDELLNEFFNTSSGMGCSVVRISIGASDLSASDYSYDEMVSGTDETMANFSLYGPDLTYLIPILKKILLINPEIKILATPWSAPRWMKTNNAWIGGSLNVSYYEAYALYFVKYFDAMKAEGIDIWAITPQNEPENPNNEPSMLMTSTQQKNFINNNLGPAMATAGYSNIKIIAFDHNCDNTAYPIDVCNNSAYVDGAAFHLYAGDISAMTTVKNATGKNVYFTEQYTGAGGSFGGDLGWHMQNVVIGSTKNWSKAVFEWNLATNASYGPRTPGGCSTCLGAVTISTSTTYVRNVSYYIIGQISKFVKSDALRISSTATDDNLLNVAFKNPDGRIAVLVFNNGSVSSTFKIVFGAVSFSYTLPVGAAATFCWNNYPLIVKDDLNTGSFDRISFFPNPAKDFITFKQENYLQNNLVEIFSISGKLVLSAKLEKTLETVINISSLEAGLYSLKLNGEALMNYNKFVKQ